MSEKILDNDNFCNHYRNRTIIDLFKADFIMFSGIFYISKIIFKPIPILVLCMRTNLENKRSIHLALDFLFMVQEKTISGV